MIIFGVESLGLSSNNVALAVSMLCCDEHIDYTYESLKNLCVEYKLNVSEQVKKGREIDKVTYKWWKTRSENLQEKYLDISGMSVVDCLNSINENLKVYRDNHAPDTIILSRGFLSKYILESLYRGEGMECPIKHNQFRETATMIDCLKESGSNGFCVTDKNISYSTADLIEKTAYDAYMILKGQ